MCWDIQAEEKHQAVLKDLEGEYMLKLREIQSYSAGHPALQPETDPTQEDPERELERAEALNSLQQQVNTLEEAQSRHLKTIQDQAEQLARKDRDHLNAQRTHEQNEAKAVSKLKQDYSTLKTELENLNLLKTNLENDSAANAKEVESAKAALKFLTSENQRYAVESKSATDEYIQQIATQQLELAELKKQVAESTERNQALQQQVDERKEKERVLELAYQRQKQELIDVVNGVRTAQENDSQQRSAQLAREQSASKQRSREEKKKLDEQVSKWKEALHLARNKIKEHDLNKVKQEQTEEKLRNNLKVLQEHYQEKARDVEDLKNLLKNSVTKFRSLSADLARVKTARESDKQQYLGELKEKSEELAQRNHEKFNVSKERDGLLQQCMDLQGLVNSADASSLQAISTAEAEVAQIKQVNESLLTKIDDLERKIETAGDRHSVQTKIIDDQNDTIKELKTSEKLLMERKESLKERERELMALVDETDEQKSKLQTKLDSLTEELNVLEEREKRRKEEAEDEMLSEKVRRLERDNRKLEEEIEKKTQAVSWVEQEVASMRSLFRDREQKQSSRHEAELVRVQETLETERNKVLRVTEEVKATQQKYESSHQQYTVAQEEIVRLKEQVSRCEDEMRALLREMERRKRAALQLAKALQ